MTFAVGSIDYFGYAGLDLAKVEARLPVHAGQEVSFDTFDQTRAAIQASVYQAMGLPATNVAAVCCDSAYH